MQYPLVGAMVVDVSWFLATTVGGYLGNSGFHLVEAIFGGLLSAVLTYVVTDWNSPEPVSRLDAGA